MSAEANVVQMRRTAAAAVMETPAAERAVLGAVLIDAGTEHRAFSAARGVLSVDDFASAKHRDVWRAMEGLVSRGEPVDPQTLHAEMVAQGTWDASYDATFGLDGVIPTTAHVAYHARLVRDAARRRRLVAAVDQVRHTLADPTVSLRDAQATAHATLTEASAVEAEPARTARAAAVDTLRRIEGERGVDALKTGWNDLDLILVGGLRPERLYVLGGREGAGKTALALQVAGRVARQGARVLFLSMEMGAAALCERLLSSYALVDYAAIQMRRLSPDEITSMTTALDHVPPQLILRDIRQTRTAEVAAAVAQARPKLLVVDFLQKLLPAVDRRSDTEENRIARVAMEVTELARSAGIAVIGLAALNRNAEQRADQAPQTADLFGSSRIGSEADTVMLLHREADAVRTPDGAVEVMLYVRKNRGGTTRPVRLMFRGRFQRFDED